MDSLSQLTLGAAVTVAVMGKRVPLWQSALVGAIAGTLPDLDVFIDHGDAIRNMTLHRTESHALLWLTLIAPLLAWLVAVVSRSRPHWRGWCLAIWLALITHPLLDLTTVYGTQLGLPFTNFPYAIGSMYIIDPLYTLPLLIALLVALWRRDGVGLRWNQAGLLISTLYLGWSMVVQGIATQHINRDLTQQSIQPQQVLVTPTAFNTLVWRTVIMTPDRYGEAYWSMLSPDRALEIHWHPRNPQLFDAFKGDWYAERVAWFSHGFYAMRLQGEDTLISDLRMGEAPNYTFTFNLGSAHSPEPALEREPSVRPSLAQAWHKLRERL
ncbi:MULTISPECIES: metal-dependent hydrolase [unclassified Pantoea]|uniref:metal-dependent hydrolase n=1 Tax=unclassified Pantoea TaxID=2630326 RepID=UPI001CD24173|nr:MULTISPECIES: metal-dependent hydrolase [unclassified Pantoea]MCA1175409.1 metal-dependent hydrolase [Pantoea sp. alder69]MCA1251386.1 metal-dependent hydrolase [Pantoea sp. alder70]MCA1263674.1 metal-dependent hydrolase [Pantoea sp. alder81]